MSDYNSTVFIVSCHIAFVLFSSYESFQSYYVLNDKTLQGLTRKISLCSIVSKIVGHGNSQVTNFATIYVPFFFRMHSRIYSYEINIRHVRLFVARRKKREYHFRIIYISKISLVQCLLQNKIL